MLINAYHYAFYQNKMSCQKKFMQHFLIIHILSMLSMLYSFFGFFSTDIQYKEKIDITNKGNTNSIDYDDEEVNDTFDSELYPVDCLPKIKKNSSYTSLPITNDDCVNYNISSFNKEICYNCNTKLIIHAAPTYHAYDKRWCFNCWRQLKINK